MKINLRYGYRGKPSHEREIPAGEYDESDPALFGLVGYLVKTGHATIISETPVTVEFVSAAELPEVPFAAVVEVIDEVPVAGFPMPIKRGRKSRQ